MMKNKILLLSNFISRCKRSNACLPSQTEGPQHLLEATTNKLYVGRETAQGLAMELCGVW